MVPCAAAAKLVRLMPGSEGWRKAVKTGSPQLA